MPLTLLVLLATSTAPDLKLVGLVQSRENPVVILASGVSTRVAAVGESAFGHRVVAAANGVVTLERDGQRVELRLRQAQPQAPVAGAERAIAVGTAAENTPMSSVRSFSREDVSRRLREEIPRILAETSIIPIRRDGRVVGLTLSRIPPGSMLMDAGLVAGDVLTRVDGVDMDSTASLLALWPRLQTASEVTATVLRAGEPFSVQVRLR
jgi:type II secretion system protein C